MGSILDARFVLKVTAQRNRGFVELGGAFKMSFADDGNGDFTRKPMSLCASEISIMHPSTADRREMLIVKVKSMNAQCMPWSETALTAVSRRFRVDMRTCSAVTTPRARHAVRLVVVPPHCPVREGTSVPALASGPEERADRSVALDSRRWEGMDGPCYGRTLD